jgi:hypothetical protein
VCQDGWRGEFVKGPTDIKKFSLLNIGYLMRHFGNAGILFAASTAAGTVN